MVEKEEIKITEKKNENEIIIPINFLSDNKEEKFSSALKIMEFKTSELSNTKNFVSNYSQKIKNEESKSKESKQEKEIGIFKKVSNSVSKAIKSIFNKDSKEKQISEDKKKEKDIIETSIKHESSHPVIKKHLIKNILFDYYSLSEIFARNSIGVSKYLSSMIKFEVVLRQYNYKNEIIATNYKNTQSFSFEIKDIIGIEENPSLQIKAILIEFESKDQGWASVNSSSSWISLDFKKEALRMNDDEEEERYFEDNPYYSTNIVHNFKVRDYKKRSILLKENELSTDKASKSRNIFDAMMDRSTLVSVSANALYPGWECYLKNFSVKYYFVEIKL